MSLLATDEPINEAVGLPAKVLKARAGEVLGLIAFLLVVVLGAIVWRGLGGVADLAAAQQATKAAVDHHATKTEHDGKLQRQLLRAICLGVQKTTEGQTLCEVGQ